MAACCSGFQRLIVSLVLLSIDISRVLPFLGGLRLPVLVIDWLIVTKQCSKSTSHQRNAKTSPMRAPVAIASFTANKKLMCLIPLTAPLGLFSRLRNSLLTKSAIAASMALSVALLKRPNSIRLKDLRSGLSFLGGLTRAQGFRKIKPLNSASFRIWLSF